MNAIQATSPLRPQANLKAAHHVQGLSPLPPILVSYGRGPVRYPSSIKLIIGRQKCPHLMPVCSSRGEASSGNGSKADQDPLWKSFGRALENFGKKSSLEDELRQRTKEGKFYDEGGSGRNPPWGRGGGGAGAGGGGGSGESEDEGFSGKLDETMQVILATLGLIFVYVYIINGAELTLLVKDYIKFLFKGKKSARLSRALDEWETLLECLNVTKVTVKKVRDKLALEKAIIITPTWWNYPVKYRSPKDAFEQSELELPIEESEPQIQESESSYSE